MSYNIQVRNYKKRFSVTASGSMQIVLVLLAEVMRYLWDFCRHPNTMAGEWNFVCGAHRIKKNKTVL